MRVLNNQTIRLSDGRTLGYAEYGDPSGKVVFFLHGQPGNRLFHPDPVITKNAGIRLIIPDRPGYGRSTFNPERSILDWPHDLSQLADTLAVEHFGLIGFSAGGPYALACAAVFPEKITRLLLISSAPPLSEKSLLAKMPLLVRLNFWIHSLFPKLFYFSFRWYWTQARKNPHHFIQMAKNRSSSADRMVFEDEDTYQMMLASWKENLRNESKGYTADAEILFSDWGIDLAKISIESILWWGDQDLNTPSFVREYFAQNLPKTKILRRKDAGHFGFLQDWDRICITMRNPLMPTEEKNLGDDGSYRTHGSVL
jgi:pimeloyl-ACP methyl ester carboxylesterase